MKELSIEEKAKRYDEAIEKGKQIQNTPYTAHWDIMKEVAEHLLPELKESEDEKMMNQLHSWMKEFGGAEEYTEKVYQWIKGLLEKQGEQKSDDKVEPKFKVGDWIVNNEYNNVAEVLEVNEQYKVDYHDTIGTVSIEVIDNNYHLWTIQDAKDGNVLANKYGSVFIYAGFEDDKRVTVNDYCYITANHEEFYVETHETGSWYYVDGLNPATKEQRNLLFQKMKEAGYEWNADKKELKKIEQKPAWSEEDEKILSDIIKDLAHPWNEYIPDRIENEIKWLKNRLKSLKDKVQSQREWNEEDKEQLDKALYMMEQLDMTKSWDDVYNWLKSLRPQNSWKPSDEQMQALSDAGNSFRPFEEGHKVLWSLYNDLKKLREEQL